MYRLIIVSCVIHVTTAGLASFSEAEKQCILKKGVMVNLETEKKVAAAHAQHRDHKNMQFWTAGKYHDDAWRWASEEPIVGHWCGDFPMIGVEKFAVVLSSNENAPCFDFLHKDGNKAGIMCQKK